MPNGIAQNGAPPAPGSIPNGTQGASFPGGGQPNGVAGPPGAPGQAQPQNLQFPGQRPVGTQHRAPNGIAHYQSPTMAHSPQNPGAVPQQQNAGPGLGPMGNTQPLTQIHSRGGMLPPNGPQNLGPAQHNQYQQHGRSPSQPGSPAQNSVMPSPSPSLASRQIQGGLMQPAEHAFQNELLRVPSDVMQRLRQEAGIGEKDLLSMTTDERQRLVNLVKQRQMQSKPGGPGAPTPTNAAAGPSGIHQMPPPHQQRNPPLMPPGQQGGPQPLLQSQAQQQAQAQQAQAQQQAQQPRGAKRNSSSPGQEQERLPNTDTSPHERKRMRRTPTNTDQPPSQAPPMVALAPGPPYSHPSQPGGPGGPPMPNGMMRPIVSFPGQPGMHGMSGNPGLNMSMGPSMTGPPGGMSPSMMHPGQNGLMNYKQSMQNIHRSAIQPGNVYAQGVPGGPDGQFSMDGGAQRPQGGPFPGGPGPAGPNRMGQNKTNMPPPPSPSMLSAKAKEAAAASPSAPNGRVDVSPQNIAAGIGQQPGPSGPAQGPPPVNAPPTPGSGNPGPGPGMANPGVTAPSPSDMLNSGPQDMFADGFGLGIGDFDPSIFRAEGADLDFGDWFTADGGGLSIDN